MNPRNLCDDESGDPATTDQANIQGFRDMVMKVLKPYVQGLELK